MCATCFSQLVFWGLFWLLRHKARDCDRQSILDKPRLSDTCCAESHTHLQPKMALFRTWRACVISQTWWLYSKLNIHEHWNATVLHLQASHFILSMYFALTITTVMHLEGRGTPMLFYLLSCPLSLFLSCWSLYSRCCFSSSCSWRCCSIFLWCSNSSCWCLSASKSCWCW